jgi:amphi-Trp domain-containing protein
MTRARTTDDFRHESIQDGKAIERQLEALGRALEAGALHLASGSNEVVLHPDGMLRSVIQVKRKGDAVKVTVRISWREEQAAPSELPLTIRAGGKGR